MKNVFLVLGMGVTLLACSEPSMIDIPDLPDASTNQPEPYNPNDPGSCDPENLARLQSDVHNCGSCGNQCTRDTSDRCIMGECFCGQVVPCEPGADCINGQCVESDISPCNTADDCNGRQTCVATPNDGKICIEVCEFDDACAAGFYCIEGACTFVECVAEDCDGIDNDCDGTVDENDTAGPLSKFCYSGPEADLTSIMSPCRAGVQVCLPEGMWSDCRDEIAPVSEQGLLACDLVDNDCDGCVDGTLEDGLCVSQEPNGFDVVFVIDTSGSMSAKLSAVISAVSTFSSFFSANPEFRFAIVLAPGETDGDVELYQNLSLFADFETALMSLPGNGSIEPQWDAVYELGTGELPVNWRENTVRIIIVFTDESGQSNRDVRGLGQDIDETEMCSALTHGEVLATVTKTSYFEDFDDCGLTFELTEDDVLMADQLGTIISDPCR